MTQMYTIKPPEWVHTQNDDYESWTWHTPVLGMVSVSREAYSSPDGSWTSWHFRWCVDEDYDEGDEIVSTSEEGKERAEKWYRERLMAALVPVDLGEQQRKAGE